MIISTVVWLLVPVLTALLLISAVWPGRKPPLSAFILRGCLAAGTGIGLLSLLFFVQCLILGPSRRAFISMQIALLAIMIGVLIYSIKSVPRPSAKEDDDDEARPRLKLERILTVIFVIALLSAAVSFIFISLKNPHGEWDAWAVYNMKARFIVRAGQYWKDLFTEPLYWTGTDYPLLIPMAVAGIWTLIGKEELAVPSIVAILFTLATAGVCASALSILRSKCQGLLSGLILLCTPYFIKHGAEQYSDIPIGFFFLATFVLLAFHHRSEGGSNRFLFLAGLTAGLASWTKNEGLLFVLAVVGAHFAVTVLKHGRKAFIREMVSFGTGVIPIVLVVLYLKFFLGQPNGLLSPTEGPSFIAKVTEFARYRIILDRYLQQALSFGDWAVSIVPLLLFYLLLLGTKIEKEERAVIVTTFIVLGIMLTGYYMIYVISPRDVDWHVVTSLNRLCSQLWPSFIFGFFMMVRTPEQALTKLDARRAAVNFVKG